MKRYSQCGVILINNNASKVLVVLQNSSKKWGLPKGHMTAEEMNSRAYFSCAKRELYEETGVYLNVLKYKMIGTIILNDKFFYVIRINKDFLWTNPVDKNEILKVKWLPLENIRDFTMSQPCNSTLSKLCRTWNQPSFPVLQKHYIMAA